MVSPVFATRSAPFRSWEALRWRVRIGDVQRVARGAFVASAAEVTELERALAAAEAANGVVAGLVAGRLLDLDLPPIRGPAFVVAPHSSGRRAGARRVGLDVDRVWAIDGIPITGPLQTLLDLAAQLPDAQWEQALESALRRQLTTIAEIEGALPEMSRARTSGVRRIRRVLAFRPPGVPPTESLLETLMVQLARELAAPEPVRQRSIYDEHGQFVGRPDLCWPDLGVFVELDGQQHRGQPLYDANRETRIVAATGWLCGRFTWDEIRRTPQVSGRRLLQVLEQARHRPLSCAVVGAD